MEKEIVELIRGPYMAHQTIGVLVSEKLKLFTLELPWKNNEFKKSCIPTGTYEVVPRFSTKYGNHFILKNVPDRSYILIHIANYVNQIEGCIGVGKAIADINRDTLVDTTDSGKALEVLVNTYPSGFILEVK